MKIARNNRFFLCLLGNCFLFVKLFAADYYISPSGNDQNPGSLSAPWRTLNKANYSLRAGDRVFIRQGTYIEDINPVHSGTESLPITFTAYPGETATIRGYGNNGSEEAIVALGYPGSCAGWGSVSHIVIDGLTLDPVHALYAVAVWGRDSEGNQIKGCTISNSDAAHVGSRGILVGEARHTLIENNTIDGVFDIGIITTYSPKYTIVRNNRITNCIGPCIDNQTSYGANQAMLIEGNYLAGSQIEDGIQFEDDYAVDFDDGTSRGVIIRNNTICNNAENAIDLKGAADVVIEGNLIYGNRGANDGEVNMSGGTGGIMKGWMDHNQAHEIIIRRNVIYDNLGAVFVPNYGWIVVHNTMLGNNRNYAGCDQTSQQLENDPYDDACRRSPKATSVILTMPDIENMRGVAIKNNIIGGHHQGEITVITTSDLSETEINGNMYFNADGVQMVDFRGNWDWSYVDFETYRNRLQSIPGPVGEEAQSFTTTNPGLNIATDAPTGPGPYDFTLKSTSPAVDRGLPLTRTLSAGSGTMMAVEYAKFFCDGYEIVAGDEIQIFSNQARARIVAVDYDSNTLTLDRSVNWTAGDGIGLAWEGNAPDLGAFEYAGTGAIPLSVSAGASVYSGEAPLNITFTSTVSGGTPPYAYQWDLGDGSTSSVPGPVHTFSDAGDYGPTVMVSDGGGSQASASLDIHVSQPSEIHINDIRLVPLGSDTETSSLQRGQWFDVYIHIYHSLGWDHNAYADVWLSGPSAAENTVENRGGPFHAKNNYVLSLSLADHTLWVRETEGSGDFSEGTGRMGVYTDDDNNEYQINENEMWARARIQLLPGAETGNWTVNAYSVDAAGEMSELVTENFSLKSVPPFNVSIHASSTSGPQPLAASFTTTVSGGTPPYHFYWSFGDGATSTEQNPAHVYLGSGIFQVQLMVTDNQNQVRTTGVYMEVIPKLNVDIIASSTSGEAPLTVEFSGSATGGEAPYLYVWDFGDGSVSTDVNPSHVYEDAREYQASLQVRDTQGMKSGKSVVIQVTAATPDIRVTDTRFVRAADQIETTAIQTGEWYDLILSVTNSGGWANNAYVDVWLSGPSCIQGTAENRGGPYYAQKNYVLTYSLADTTLWARQTEGSMLWSEVTGRRSVYADDDNREYQINGQAMWASARVQLLTPAENGTWRVQACAVDLQGNHSDVYSETFTVSAPVLPPTAVIVPDNPAPVQNGPVVLTLTTSKNVTRVPGPLVFTENDRTVTEIVLTGPVPGKLFSGTLMINPGVAAGPGTFSLPENSLVAEDGTSGHAIVSGASFDIQVDRTAPNVPKSISIQLSSL